MKQLSFTIYQTLLKWAKTVADLAAHQTIGKLGIKVVIYPPPVIGTYQILPPLDHPTF